MSGIKLIEVRVENFRALKRAVVTLGDLTVLIGENNSGKTGFLEALHAVLGLGRRLSLSDDIFVAPEEVQAPRERAAIIDVLIRPVDEHGTIIDSFPAKSPWLALWGNGVAQDNDDNDLVAIRATIRWNATKGEYEIERKYLLEWVADSTKLAEGKLNEKARVLNAHIEPLALYFLDAKRDMQDELASRASFWGKLVSDLGLPKEKVEELEKSLTDLNSKIVSNSGVLAHVQEHLDEIYKTLSCSKDSVSITPLSRHLRDFNKGLDINFKTNGSSSFPLSRHGMGTRSLAAVLAFRAYTTWRHKQGIPGSVHSLLGLEEPESHLHPQAQRALFSQLKAIPGQKIVSTHSPYVASQADIVSIRHFRKHGSETSVSMINTSGLTSDDLRKIDRQVMNTRGELLYARAVVFFEGETEEQAFPIFAETYFGLHPNTLGLSLIGVGGNNYLPFLRLAHGFDIPWVIFSDGEPDAVRAVDAALKGIGIPDRSKTDNVVVLSKGENFEQNLLAAGYEAEVSAGIAEAFGPTYIDDFIRNMDGKKKSGGGARDYKGADGKRRAILDIMLRDKTALAAPIARSICSADKKRRTPPELLKVFRYLSKKFGWAPA